MLPIYKNYKDIETKKKKDLPSCLYLSFSLFIILFIINPQIYIFFKMDKFLY